MCGVVLLGIVALAGSLADRKNLNRKLDSTMEYLRQQCRSYDQILSSDRTKSLIRLTAQAVDVSNDIKRAPHMLQDDYLSGYVKDQRLAGIAVLDENMNPDYEYSNCDISFKDWKKECQSDSVSNIKDYPQKIFCERVIKMGKYYDIAAVSRRDAPGVVFVYCYKDSEIMVINQAAIENLMTGYDIEMGGVVYITKENVIHRTNDKSITSKNVFDAPILKKMESAKNGKSILRIKSRGNVYFGRNARYKEYRLFVYYPRDEIFEKYSNWSLFFVCIYTTLCLCWYIVRNRAEKRHVIALNNQLSIVKAISTIYTVTVLIDLQNDSFEIINAPEDLKHLTYEGMSLEKFFESINIRYVDEEFKESYSKFIKLSEINERLREKDYVEYVYKNVSGRWFRNILIPKERNADGDTLSAVLVTRNIDEQKKTEIEYQEKLKKTTEEAVRANAAKTDFLRRMSHDIRTPINVIMGMVEIGDRFPEDMQKQIYCREKVHAASALLLDLVNDVLSVNKLDSGVLNIEENPFDLRTVLGEICALVNVQAKDKGVGFEIVPLAVENYHLIGSPLHLRQVVMNIAGNAIKYTPKGGTVTLSCREVSHEAEKCLIEIVCTDTGIGMTEEFQKHMFEPFAQEEDSARSSFGGIGLGLAIVEKLVEKMGGSISVSSKKGEGSTFTIRLPFKIDKENRQAPLVPEKHEHASISGLKVLLAEDNELNMEIAEFLLCDEGALVTKAWNGREVLNIWNGSEPGSFDVILIDLMMPEKDGIQATKEIRASARPDAKTIPIIAMSANVFEEDVKRCTDAGMNEHISKPLDINRLIEVIAKFVKR